MNLSIGNPNAGNPLVALPDEIRLAVLNLLPDGDLAHRIPLICKDFLRISQDEKLWQKRSVIRFGLIEANKSYVATQSWKATYIALKKLEMTKIKEAVEKKQKIDDIQQRTMSAVSASFGFNVNPNQSHYYPTQSSAVMFGGKLRKLTVYKSYQ